MHVGRWMPAVYEPLTEWEASRMQAQALKIWELMCEGHSKQEVVARLGIGLMSVNGGINRIRRAMAALVQKEAYRKKTAEGWDGVDDAAFEAQCARETAYEYRRGTKLAGMRSEDFVTCPHCGLRGHAVETCDLHAGLLELATSRDYADTAGEL